MAELKSGRLWSLDAYRGLIMLLLAANGFGLLAFARNELKEKPDSVIWQTVRYHTDHPEWTSNTYRTGVSIWDLIQPSFMFMVGVAVPFSYAKRAEQGEPGWKSALHAVGRSILLILLGVFLTSADQPKTKWEFVNVLTQIGLGYLALLFLMGLPPFLQFMAMASILVGYWLWFVGTPVPGVAAWQDFAAHFQKNENAAAYFDRWFLGLFSDKPPIPNRGGYATLNFIPSIATMILGLMSGELLQSTRRGGLKVLMLAAGGIAMMGAGVALGETVCPIVKRIWTPSWVLFSGAYCVWILAALYLVLDVADLKWLGWPLVVLGANSLLLYLMGQLMRPWVASQLKIHFGPTIFDGRFGPIIQSCAVMGVFWLLCLWLYRKRLFVRL